MRVQEKSTIKRIPIKDLPAFVDIIADAYPGMKISAPEEKKKTVARLKQAARDPLTDYYGLYRSHQLLGGMALYDFTMNYHSIDLPIPGVGLVAVDLLHKKEHVCKELIQFFHTFCRKKKVPMTALYPFRPDFYKKMGYGYGTKVNQYYFKPSDLPVRGFKEHVRYMEPGDHRAIKACYERFRTKHHGMFTERAMKWTFLFASSGRRVLVYQKEHIILGYLVYSFKKVQEANWIKNDIIVHEFIYETREALSGLLCFLHTQLDQIHRVVYATQDDNFHHMLHDPRDGTDTMFVPLAHQVNRQGVGIMYRVIDTGRLFTVLHQHDFGGMTCTIKMSVIDDFLPDNDGSIVIRFDRGIPEVLKTGKVDVEIRMDVADFSSLIMGVVGFQDLYLYGLIEISKPPYLDTLNRLFHSIAEPITTTQF
ncbi:GNAT family N-acetyltransferase [candidate division WOR-3 bacterium]|nr:GNAT family N-acetyltransferase [candidate division WOR-3 bacterium]